MNQKRNYLWILVGLAWAAVVVSSGWWNISSIKTHLAQTAGGHQDSWNVLGQVMGVHLFIMLTGLAGLFSAYLLHKRSLAEKNETLNALTGSEKRFRGIFENASVGIAQVDPGGKLIRFNQPFVKLAGRSAEELEACNMRDLFIRSHHKAYQELTGETLEGKRDSFTLELRFGAWRSEPVWGHLSLALIRKPDGAPDYFVVVVKNITDRKQAEKKLFESEERFRVAFETSPDSVAINRLRDGMYISINPGFTNILGWTKEDVAGKTSLELNIWHDQADRQRLVDGLLRDGKLAGFEAKFQAKDGTLVDALMSAAITQLNGEPHIVTITNDIRNLKAAHQKLAEQQQRIEAFMLANPDPVVVFGIDRNCVYMNPAFTRVFGWTLDDVHGKRIPYIPEHLEQTALAAIEEIKTTGKTQPRETQRLTKDGRLVDVLLSAAGIIDQNNEVTGMVVNLHDITALKKAETRQRRLATAFEQAAEAVFITDLNGNILHVNPAFEKITGYSRKEAIGQNPRFLKSGHQDKAFYRELWRTINSGQTWSGRMVNRRKNGEIFHEEATISPVRDSDGVIVNFVAVKRDVTKEINLEQRLRRSEKMEAIGTMAGGIAHDFNNILSAITGYSELALDELSRDIQMAQRDLRQVLSAAARAKSLIRQILTFSREVEPDLKPLDLNKVLSQSLGMLERTLPKTIEIRFDRHDSLPYIRADFSQIEQVILNLGTNARDAMGGSGTLFIQTSEEYLDLDYCRMEEGLEPGRYVKLEISDTGCGMDKSIQERIFEPFFTTKEPGKGTGLGLAMVFGIIKAHKGHLTCYSQPDQGSTFKLYLPVLEQADRDFSLLEQANAELPIGNETILLVDDEEQLREMTGRILEDRGFSVCQAENGEQGLELYRDAPGEIDLVVLDLSMPGMGGQKCLEKLLELDPEAKVVISSGYAANGAVARTLETGAAAFVSKPYNKSKLLHTVRQVLDGNNS